MLAAWGDQVEPFVSPKNRRCEVQVEYFTEPSQLPGGRWRQTPEPKGNADVRAAMALVERRGWCPLALVYIDGPPDPIGSSDPTERQQQAMATERQLQAMARRADHLRSEARMLPRATSVASQLPEST